MLWTVSYKRTVRLTRDYGDVYYGVGNAYKYEALSAEGFFG